MIHEGSLVDAILEHLTECIGGVSAVIVNNDPGQLDDEAVRGMGLVHVRTDYVGGKRIRIYDKPKEKEQDSGTLGPNQDDLSEQGERGAQQA